MAISFGSAGGGARGGRGGRRSFGPSMAEINIIPLVDVVLVLLIIFMLTAHVMEFGLEINVPKVDVTRQSADELPVVSLDKIGQLFIGEKKAKNIRTLAEEVKQRYPGAKAVYVRADKNTTVDPVFQAIAVLGKGKLEVRLVTQPDDGK
jgi:biopolymer transport protein ExbD